MPDPTPEHIAAVGRLATTMNGVKVALDLTAQRAVKDMPAEDAAAWLNAAEDEAILEIKNQEILFVSEHVEATGTQGAFDVVRLAFNDVRRRLGLPER